MSALSIPTVPEPDLELLGSAGPAWLWHAGRTTILWANDRAVRLWGAASLARLQALRFDSAMPAVRRLLDIAAGRPGEERRERLVFWTPSGSQSLRCLCRRVRYHADDAVLEIRLEEAPATQNAHTGVQRPADADSPRIVAPPVSAEDHATLEEIARLIRSGAGRAEAAAAASVAVDFSEAPEASAATAPGQDAPAPMPAPEDPPPPGATEAAGRTPGLASELTQVELIAKISHEIRTPLSSIIGFAEIMRDERLGPIDNEKYRGYLADIVESARHTLSLANDLLDLSRLAAGAVELDFVELEAAETLGSAIRLMRPQAEAAGVAIREAVQPGLPRLIADRRAMRQILINLLSNAIRHSATGGTITVSAVPGPALGLVLCVHDTGSGMTEAELARALQPFPKQPAGSEARSGSGLGLPLTRALAEANGATLSISSRPGAGTTVSVGFPSGRLIPV